ncbi:hypothetical protein V5N11_026725 [Cardamine amara subsp. amara]|uniref:Uncharacterized protein n=1 Tax=Cardamine amara subsp. amara TaxID=228776 RepID=A0ABD1BYB7_CARAN
MMERLRKWALERKFVFKTLWSNTTRVILGCVNDKYSWRLRALVVPHSEFFVVKKLVDKQACDTTHKNPNHRQATATTLASLICSGYHEKNYGLKAKQIIDLVRMNHGVQIKYKKAWRTKEIDESLVRGTPEDSYHNLAKWLFKVQEKNI